jgi:hypothetical protein
MGAIQSQEASSKLTAAQPKMDPAASRLALSAVRGHLATLAAEVDEAKRSAGFTAMLDATALFWRYSPVNQGFIRQRCPKATLVAGRKVWAKLGRTPKASARPIGILAFAPGRKPPFVDVSVFDVSQTRGKPLPELDWVLSGDTELVQLLERAAARLGVAIEQLSDDAPELGLSEGGTIRVRVGLSGVTRTAVIAHELAHEILHQGAWATRKRPLPRSVREVEAEATGYVVMKALGLPSKAPVYVAWYGGTGEKLAASFGRIQRAARTILEAAGADVFSARKRQ